MSSVDRFRRQIAYAPVGLEGQQALSSARVGIVGLGALGSMLAERLARVGVGHLRLIDRDWVELDNLPRQSLYTLHDAEYHATKASAAAERIAAIDPTLHLEPLVVDVTHRNVSRLIDGLDLVLDGTDNFETRYLINDACVSAGKPWVHAGIVGAAGQCMLVDPPKTACFRCLLPDPPPLSGMQTCDSVGVLGPAVGVIASWQAMLALKYLVGRHRERDLHLDADSPKSRLTAFDLWTGDVRTMVLPRVEDCPCCMQRHFPFLDGEHASDAKTMCGKNSVQIQSPPGTEVDFDRLASRLEGHGRVVQTPFLLRFQVDSWTISLFRDGRAVVQGTENPDEARKIYQRWIGG